MVATRWSVLNSTGFPRSALSTMADLRLRQSPDEIIFVIHLYRPRMAILGMIYATSDFGGQLMKQITKTGITAAFVLFSLLMALLCVDTMLSGGGFWYYLYFGVVIAISIPLGLLIGHLLATLIVWCWSVNLWRQLTAYIISATRQRLGVK